LRAASLSHLTVLPQQIGDLCFALRLAIVTVSGKPWYGGLKLEQAKRMKELEKKTLG
jgi:hypothetical protein